MNCMMAIDLGWSEAQRVKFVVMDVDVGVDFGFEDGPSNAVGIDSYILLP